MTFTSYRALNMLRWLAEKYLEQTASGTGETTAVSLARLRASRGGVEYVGNRPYQPGDRLKEVDWKHSYMLDELVVKEFAGAKGKPAIIVADLTVKDAEDADKLTYNVVMSALTVAFEGLPSGLVLFNQTEIVMATAPMNSRETLKKALELTEKITILEPTEKVLEPVQLGRLRRSIS